MSTAEPLNKVHRKGCMILVYNGTPPADMEKYGSILFPFRETVHPIASLHFFDARTAFAPHARSQLRITLGQDISGTLPWTYYERDVRGVAAEVLADRLTEFYGSLGRARLLGVYTPKMKCQAAPKGEDEAPVVKALSFPDKTHPRRSALLGEEEIA